MGLEVEEKIFGNKFKGVRSSRSMNRGDLAEKVGDGITHRTIDALEHGVIEVCRGVVLKLIKALGASQKEELELRDCLDNVLRPKWNRRKIHLTRRVLQQRRGSVRIRFSR